MSGEFVTTIVGLSPALSHPFQAKMVTEKEPFCAGFRRIFRLVTTITTFFFLTLFCAADAVEKKTILCARPEQTGVRCKKGGDSGDKTILHQKSKLFLPSGGGDEGGGICGDSDGGVLPGGLTQETNR